MEAQKRRRLDTQPTCSGQTAVQQTERPLSRPVALPFAPVAPSSVPRRVQQKPVSFLPIAVSLLQKPAAATLDSFLQIDVLGRAQVSCLLESRICCETFRVPARIRALPHHFAA